MSKYKFFRNPTVKNLDDEAGRYVTMYLIFQQSVSNIFLSLKTRLMELSIASYFCVEATLLIYCVEFAFVDIYMLVAPQKTSKKNIFIYFMNFHRIPYLVAIQFSVSEQPNMDY